MRCDFCSAPPRFRVRAVSMAIGDVTLGDTTVHATSKGDWAACATCAALIRADERRALLDRSVRTFTEMEPESWKRFVAHLGADEARTVVFRMIAQVHATFWEAKRGDPEPEQ